ncbi:DUF3604 domain-containing protein [Phototrophicus methaneseepsis]|uniref:DUF3604 domain-containing protein n=1 Tax=Phototrophicus methaneseepsis TaxID=2710758 RepID=A0A7S8EBY9_9CHLR|nr:DUF3604 domain-containing protein [Phototrophicus methaneseepsis]QPC84034.1 DUF3604 domain-containing protein [Phototrophicus methaneseepsis]
MTAQSRPVAYQAFGLFYGDIHNHCNMSYGHGPLEDALRNARLQLDFVSVTIHAAWPDLPTDDPELGYLVDYHKEGFQKALNNWSRYQEITEANNEEGQFVTFPSFEWHSMKYGDHCIYYKDTHSGHIIDAPDLESLRDSLRQLDVASFAIPHHIGYKAGYRGINWDAFTDEISPVVEIFSFHGSSESSTGPYPYLHSMGPRNYRSTAQYGWSADNLFGVIGSTDHHNAHPGAYGYGRLAVWADALTRDGIWDAIRNRRTYALTGDRIDLAFALNDHMMGDVAPAADERTIQVNVVGGDSIDYVEVLRNNEIIHRQDVFPQSQTTGRYKVCIEMGWGERDTYTDWDVTLSVAEGQIISVEPRFRGIGPTEQDAEGPFAFSEWAQQTPETVCLKTRTWKNESLHTANTESICLEIEGSSETHITAQVNGVPYQLSLADLMQGAQTFYFGGFVSPSICFHRAIPQSEYSTQFELNDVHKDAPGRDWYTVRVRQRNNQWAWSSPIWVEPAQ